MTDINTGTVNTRASTRSLLSEMQLENLSRALVDAPSPPRKLTVNQALESLVPDLRGALDRGHTVGSLVTVLNAKGLRVGERAVAQALRAALPGTGRRMIKSPRKNVPSAAPKLD